jgi:hypothetical protein
LNNKPIEGVKINLGLFSDQTSRFLDTNTDLNGIFKFEEIDIPGKAEMFISATGKFERMQGRIFVDSIKYEPPETEKLLSDSAELVVEPINYSVFQQEAMVKLAIKKKYKLSDTIDIGDVFITAKKPDLPQEIKVKESRRVYATPDKEVVVSPNQDNFAGDVFEYISGRIPGVRVVRTGNEVKVIVRGQMSSDGAGALILLDGYEIDTLGMISVFTLSMAMVDRIDVLNASPLYGMRGANGVINIITRTGMRRGPIELSANSAAIKVNGFDAPRIFYSPKYNASTPQAFMPDIRTTIFWEPNISIKNNKNVTLNYFNADNPTTINITVEGITDEGIPLTGKTRYEVK